MNRGYDPPLSGANGVILRDLQSIVGLEHAADAGPADVINGITAAYVVNPGTVTELAQVLRLAHEKNLAIVPTGTRTKLQWGARPERVDVLLSTRRLDGLIEHAAADLVVRVQAGTPLDALQRQLGTARQMVAFDPPAGGTVGGIVATNAAGPRRLRYGAPRDLLIGITIVLSDGTIVKSGGKVVKNVAGYDLGKLFTGSFGTLGVIAEAVFRLHPTPESRRFVSIRLPGPGVAAEAVGLLTRSTLVPSAIEADWSSSAGATDLVVLFEGIETAVKRQADETEQLLLPLGRTLVSDSPQEAGWPMRAWSTLVQHDILAKLIILPIDLAPTLDMIARVAGATDVTARVVGHAATGVLYLGLRGASSESLVQATETVRSHLQARAAHLVVLHAVPAVKRCIDVWGFAGDALPLMRAVKARFDPAGLMSPGRFVGGI